jgi:hypothetical protein
MTRMLESLSRTEGASHNNARQIFPFELVRHRVIPALPWLQRSFEAQFASSR